MSGWVWIHVHTYMPTELCVHVPVLLMVGTSVHLGMSVHVRYMHE